MKFSLFGVLGVVIAHSDKMTFVGEARGAAPAVEQDGAALLQHKTGNVLKSSTLDLHRKRKAVNRGTDHAETAIANMKQKIEEIGKPVSEMTRQERRSAINEVKNLITCPYCKTLVVSFGLDVPVLEREGAVLQDEYRTAMIKTGAQTYAQFVGGDVFFETNKHHHECEGVGELGTVDLLRMDQNLTLEHAFSSGIADLDGSPSEERIDMLFDQFATNGRVGAEEFIAANQFFYDLNFDSNNQYIDQFDIQGESGFQGAFPDWNTAFALMLGAFGTEIRTHDTNPFGGTPLAGQFPQKLWNSTWTWSRQDMKRLVLEGKKPQGWSKKAWDAVDPDSRQAPTLDDHSVWSREPSQPGATFWQTTLGVFGGVGSTPANGPTGQKPYPACALAETPWR